MKYEKRALKIPALMGFKPMTKYFTASKISENKAYKILKERAHDSDSDFYCCALFKN